MKCPECKAPNMQLTKANYKSYFGGPKGDEYDVWVSDFTCRKCGLSWYHHGEKQDCQQVEMVL